MGPTSWYDILHGILKWVRLACTAKTLFVSTQSCAARVRSFAHWKRQHLSTDNLSFVAGLRGRPVVPAPDPRQKKVRRQPKAVTPKDDGDEVCSRCPTCIEQVLESWRIAREFLELYFVLTKWFIRRWMLCRTHSEALNCAGVGIEITLLEDEIRHSHASRHSHPQAREKK